MFTLFVKKTRKFRFHKAECAYGLNKKFYCETAAAENFRSCLKIAELLNTSKKLHVHAFEVNNSCILYQTCITYVYTYCRKLSFTSWLFSLSMLSYPFVMFSHFFRRSDIGDPSADFRTHLKSALRDSLSACIRMAPSRYVLSSPRHSGFPIEMLPKYSCSDPARQTPESSVGEFFPALGGGGDFWGAEYVTALQTSKASK